MQLKLSNSYIKNISVLLKNNKKSGTSTTEQLIELLTLSYMIKML